MLCQQSHNKACWPIDIVFRFRLNKRVKCSSFKRTNVLSVIICSSSSIWIVFSLISASSRTLRRPSSILSPRVHSCAFSSTSRVETSLQLHSQDECGNWNLEYGNWNLEYGNWNMEIGNEHGSFRLPYFLNL